MFFELQVVPLFGDMQIAPFNYVKVSKAGVYVYYGHPSILNRETNNDSFLLFYSYFPFFFHFNSFFPFFVFPHSKFFHAFEFLSTVSASLGRGGGSNGKNIYPCSKAFDPSKWPLSSSSTISPQARPYSRHQGYFDQKL